MMELEVLIDADALRERVEAMVRDSILAEMRKPIADAINEALNGEFQPTDAYGEPRSGPKKTLRELIAARVEQEIKLPDNRPGYSSTGADPRARVCTCGHSAYWHNAIVDGVQPSQSHVERQQGEGECEATPGCICSRFFEAKTDSYESLRRERDEALRIDPKGMAPDPIEQLGRLVLEQAGERDAIGDSDLDGEQPVSVTISTTLGLLRKAGLRYVPAYFSQAERDRAEARAPVAHLVHDARRPVAHLAHDARPDIVA